MSRDQATDWDNQRDQATALERIADALETIAQRLDLASHSTAAQLKAAEQLAATRLDTLCAVRVIVQDGTISYHQAESRILALLATVGV